MTSEPIADPSEVPRAAHAPRAGESRLAPSRSFLAAPISKAGGLLLAGGFLILKLKAVILLLLTKLKPFLVNPFEGFGLAQMLLTGGSMALSLLAYAMTTPLAFALGFVLLIFVHEVGHAVAIRGKGLRAGAMVFIPFIGGAVTLKRQPRSVYTDAQIALAGPIAGTVGSIVALLAFEWSGEVLYLALAVAGFVLNLFNLVPLAPLDGGRIAGAITKWMWVGGIMIVVGVAIVWRSPLLLLILILGVWHAWRTVTHPRPLFYSVTASQRAVIGATYFLLVAFLGYESTVRYNELLDLLH